MQARFFPDKSHPLDGDLELTTDNLMKLLKQHDFANASKLIQAGVCTKIAIFQGYASMLSYTEKFDYVELAEYYQRDQQIVNFLKNEPKPPIPAEGRCEYITTRIY